MSSKYKPTKSLFDKNEQSDESDDDEVVNRLFEKMKAKIEKTNEKPPKPKKEYKDEETRQRVVNALAEGRKKSLEKRQRLKQEKESIKHEDIKSIEEVKEPAPKKEETTPKPTPKPETPKPAPPVQSAPIPVPQPVIKKEANFLLGLNRKFWYS